MVELLVSLAVVATLAAILMAALGMVRASANRAKCITHLKTIGGGMRGYIADHKGYAPPHTSFPFFETNGARRVRMSGWHWMAHIAPYLGSPDSKGPMSPVFNCPADPNAKNWSPNRTYTPAAPDDRTHRLTSYGYNYYYLTTASSWWPRGDWPTMTYAITNPSKVFLVTDGRVEESDPIINSFSVQNRPAPRHSGQFNALFLDGHVERMEAATAADTQYWRPQ